MMTKAFWINFFSLLFLTACIPERVAPAPEIYTLSPQWDNNAQADKKHYKNTAIIKLAAIYAAQDLTSTNILYSKTPFSRDHYTFSRWNDAPTKLLQSLIQVCLEKSNLFQAVIPTISASKTDLILETTLQDLSHRIHEDGSSEGIIRANFYLIDNSTNKVLATKEFVSRVSASRQNAQAAVIALNKAATKMANDLVSWLAENMNQRKSHPTLCSENC